MAGKKKEKMAEKVAELIGCCGYNCHLCAARSEDICDKMRHLMAIEKGMFIFGYKNFGQISEEDYNLCMRQWSSIPNLYKILLEAGKLPECLKKREKVKCNIKIVKGEERDFNCRILCEDCYIDAILPSVRKIYYENDSSEFMRRLKDSYIACPQKFHYNCCVIVFQACGTTFWRRLPHKSE